MKKKVIIILVSILCVMGILSVSLKSISLVDIFLSVTGQKVEVTKDTDIKMKLTKAIEQTYDCDVKLTRIYKIGKSFDFGSFRYESGTVKAHYTFEGYIEDTGYHFSGESSIDFERITSMGLEMRNKKYEE